MNKPLFEIGEEVKVNKFAYPKLMEKTGTIIYIERKYPKWVYTIYFWVSGTFDICEEFIEKIEEKPIRLSEETKKLLEDVKMPLFSFGLGYMTSSKQKRIVPTYIGYKGRTITLVWKDGTKTQAVAKKDEKYDALYGFFIAYYKYIHRDMHSEALQKRLQERVYQGTEDYQFGYLSSVFQENCGLSGKKITKFFNDYLYIHYPFEDDEDNISRTYKVDEKYL